MSYSVNIYQILKIIDLSYENSYFSEELFNLEKLAISRQRLHLILENLINSGFITGISIKRTSYNSRIVYSCPRLTTEGMLFLEENTSMKKAYQLLKEVRDWLPLFSK